MATFARISEKIIEIDGARFELAFPRDIIAERVGQLATSLAERFADTQKPVMLVGILKGCIGFLPDISRTLEVSHSYAFVEASSRGSAGSGVVRASKLTVPNIQGAHTVILDVAQHTGLSTKFLLANLAGQEPLSLVSATLFRTSPTRSEESVEPAFIGFDVAETAFPLVGYGMDIAEQGRNLPDVYAFVQPDMPASQ